MELNKYTNNLTVRELNDLGFPVSLKMHNTNLIITSEVLR